MFSEAQDSHPYQAILPAHLVEHLAAHRDIPAIDRFIYGLIHDAPIEELIPTYAIYLSDPGFTSAVNQYIEHAEKTGKIEDYKKYLEINYPEIHIQDVQDIALFSTWRTFMVYPWEEGFHETQFTTYIYNSLRFLAREVKERTHESLLENSSSFLSPEMQVIQAEEREVIINRLVETTTHRAKTGERKKEMLRLLAHDIKPKDIAQIMGIPYHRVKQWIRDFQKVDIVQKEERVNVDVRGQWVWDQHTAEVILRNDQAISLLTQKEQAILTQFSLGVLYPEIQEQHPTLRRALQSIKYKIKTHGLKTSSSTESFKLSQRSLVTFVESIVAINETEEAIIRAIVDAQGNIKKAARLLAMPRNKIMYFLRQKGYYLK